MKFALEDGVATGRYQSDSYKVHLDIHPPDGESTSTIRWSAKGCWRIDGKMIDEEPTWTSLTAVGLSVVEMREFCKAASEILSSNCSQWFEEALKLLPDTNW